MRNKLTVFFVLGLIAGALLFMMIMSIEARPVENNCVCPEDPAPALVIPDTYTDEEWLEWIE